MQRAILAAFAILMPASALAAPLDGRAPADDVFYHFMPIAWRDSDNDTYRYGDFGGMTDSLDYLADLGVTAVWMNPIFPSPAYHGYQHGPGDQLNSWFGNEADFLAFVDAAHAHGIKVCIDFVVYGISHNSTWYQSAYGNPGSPYDDWLAFTNSGNTSYLGSTYSSWNGGFVGFIHWNLNNASPANLVTTWAQHWLDPDGDGDPADGIDGYRLDHVWNNYPSGPNGWGYNIDDFWVPWKQALQTVNPDVFTFAEQADWGSYGVDLMPGFDATMTKPFEFSARDALRDEYAAPLYNQMASTYAQVPAGKLFMGIIGDHDVTRLASEIGGGFDKGKAAAAVLLTQPFPPIIYFGDEIGMRGYKTGCSGDATDIGMREPFKWNAIAGPPMSNYWAANGCAVSNAFSQNNDGRSVEEQLGVSGSLLEEYKLLIAARKGNVALRQGGYLPVSASSSRVWAFVRDDAAQQVLVAINVYGASQSFALDLSGFDIPGGSTTPVDLTKGGTLSNITDANEAAYSMTLPAYGYRVLEVELVPGEPPPADVDGRDIPADFGAGALVATQDNATGLGDNVSELNQLFVRVEQNALRIGITGNLATDGTGLALLLDTTAGGQNTLDLNYGSPPPAGPDQIDGLQLDAGFQPDHLLWINAYSGTIYVDQFELLTGGGNVKTYRGNGTVNDGDGLLTGAVNPNGMQVALDNTNTQGVTGVSASGAATATTGFEMIIPFADVDLPANPTEPFGVAAFLLRTDGDVSNQWLPGLGGGYDNLGFVPIDLGGIAGQQHVFVDPAPAECLGDLNGDLAVDLTDLAILLSNYETGTSPAQGDLNGDGVVDLTDLAQMLAVFGSTC